IREPFAEPSLQLFDGTESNFNACQRAAGWDAGASFGWFRIAGMGFKKRDNGVVLHIRCFPSALSDCQSGLPMDVFRAHIGFITKQRAYIIVPTVPCRIDKSGILQQLSTCVYLRAMF